MILVCFQSKSLNITVIQSLPQRLMLKNAEKANVEQFYEDLQDLIELTPKKISFSS